MDEIAKKIKALPKDKLIGLLDDLIFLDEYLEKEIKDENALQDIRLRKQKRAIYRHLLTQNSS